MEDLKTEAMLSEDKARKSMMEAAKLADDLRMEQENTNRYEAERKMLEGQVKDLQVNKIFSWKFFLLLVSFFFKVRLDDAEMNALKNGRKAAQKMESRIKELENELDSEQRRLADASKNLRKNERRLKEMEFQEEEDRKQNEHMQDLVDKLQQKVINRFEKNPKVFDIFGCFSCATSRSR